MRAILIAGVLLAPLLLAAPAAAAADGTVTGQVVDKTSGGGAVADVEVTLNAFLRETYAKAADPVVARTDAAGRFAFGAVDTDPARGYVVTAEYRGVMYGSDPVAFAAGETAKAVQVAVYRTTDRGDAIRLTRQHLIVTPDLEARTLSVVEIAVVQNGGDTTFTGSADIGGTVRLVLPSEAYDVDLGRVLAQSSAMAPGAIVYTGPLAPGQTELIVGYALDLGTGPYVLRKLVTVDTAGVDVLVEDVGLSARSDQLAGPTNVETGGKKYLRLTATGLAAGSVYAIELGGTAAPFRLDASLLAPIGLIGLALVSGYVLVAPSLRRRRAPAKGPVRRERAEADDEDEIELEDEAEA